MPEYIWNESSRTQFPYLNPFLSLFGSAYDDELVLPSHWTNYFRCWCYQPRNQKLDQDCYNGRTSVFHNYSSHRNSTKDKNSIIHNNKFNLSVCETLHIDQVFTFYIRKQKMYNEMTMSKKCTIKFVLRYTSLSNFFTIFFQKDIFVRIAMRNSKMFSIRLDSSRMMFSIYEQLILS